MEELRQTALLSKSPYQAGDIAETCLDSKKGSGTDKSLAGK